MSQKKVKLLICGVIFVILVLSINIILGAFDGKKELTVSCQAEQDDSFQIYYCLTDGAPYSEENSVKLPVSGGDPTQVTFPLPADAALGRFRLDLGEIEGNVISLEGLRLWNGHEVCDLGPEQLAGLLEGENVTLADLLPEEAAGRQNVFRTASNDAWMELSLGALGGAVSPRHSVFRQGSLPILLLSLVVSLALTYVVYRVVYLRDLIEMAKGVVANRRLIINMAANDFRSHYAGSYFGRIWAFIQPLCTIVIYWFVFDIGLHSSSMSVLPFSLWLTAGLVPWMFFTEAWNGMTNVFLEYSYLVKKVVFELDIMPFIKLLSAMFTHVIFLLITVVIYVALGYAPSLWAVQIVYYLFALCCFTVALSFITASIMVFVRDTVQFMNIVLQFGMWLTPILWHVSIFPASFGKFFKMNPMYYIVQGYRDCLVADRFILFSDLRWALYFWVFTGILLCVGISIFRRLKVHFADVL